MKLWEKDIQVDQEVHRFTTANDRILDLKLSYWDVLGSMAHVHMLESVNLISTGEKETLISGLKDILKEIESGDFVISEEVEDVHSQIELLLTERKGSVGKKIHTGRSRNDQVLVDLKLYLRNELEELVHLSAALFEELWQQSERTKDLILPGYTHMQVAMPSSFGMWFGAYAECLVEDLYQLQATFKVINQNPLGSAAGYGSSFPLDRMKTTELLGFNQLAVNSVFAQMGRGRTEKSMAFSISMLASTLGKLSMDICLYNSQNFGFLKLPDVYTTGSSIMPHKKNPDVFELIRGKSNTLQSLPFQINSILVNLPSGYHRDLQLLKEVLFPAIESMKELLKLTAFAVSKLEVQPPLPTSKTYELMYTVDAVNELVMAGIPFRDAYKTIGLQVEQGTFQAASTPKDHTHLGSIGNLGNEEIRQKWEDAIGIFNFQEVRKSIETLIKIQ